MLEMYDYFHDDRLASMKFDFDLTKNLLSQNLIIIVEKKHYSYDEEIPVLDGTTSYLLQFSNVSNFNIQLKSGLCEINSVEYCADCLYILEMNLTAIGNKHSRWDLKFIDNIGYVSICADSLTIQKQCHG